MHAVRSDMSESRSVTWLPDWPALQNPIVVAPLAIAIASAGRLALDPLLKNDGPYLFFAIAVVVAALYGGKWAGLAGIVLSIPICDYLFIEPRYTWFVHDARADSIMLALFALLGVLTTIIIDGLHQSKKRVRHSLIELQRSELQLEMIDANIPEAIFTATPAGGAEHLNGFFSKYSGRGLDELTGRGWLDVIHPGDRQPFMAELALPENEAAQFETVIRLRRSDGIYHSFKCHARRNLSPHDRASIWFGACADIENEKALSAALENRTEELIRLNQSLERFAYAASHDLREPLRTIASLTEAFLRRKRGELDVESSEMLALVVKSADRMMRLIHDIMELARTANASVKGAVEVEMRTVAESAIANLGGAITEAGANIVVGDLPALCVSETALVRVFQNIIENAIKYHGPRPPRIDISAELRGDEWVFSIKDNGIGIDPEYRDKIFEPFRRLHARSQYEGTGLGLATCRRIIQALGGRIWVESVPGDGCAFFFTIPRLQSECADQTAGAVESQAPAPPGDTLGALGKSHGRL